MSMMNRQPVAMETSLAMTMATYQLGMVQPWMLHETWLRTMSPTSMRTLSQRGSRMAPVLVFPYFLARNPSSQSPVAAMMNAESDMIRRVSSGWFAFMEFPYWMAVSANTGIRSIRMIVTVLAGFMCWKYVV